MKYILVFLVISLTYSLTTYHPNSLKQTIDYTFQGKNWPGTCRSGTRQSPIAIDKYDKIPKSCIKLIDYGKESGKVEFNGSFYRIDVANSKSKVSYFDMNTKKTNKYTLKRVIFKTPAEHQIESKSFDMEIQLVHQTSDNVHNNLLIISIMAKAILKKKEVHEFWNSIDFYGNKNSDLSLLKQVMEESNDYFVYEGSQTVPNCVENVVWVIFQKPITVGLHELNASQRLFCTDCMPKGNTRAIQRIGDRTVFRYSLGHR